MVPPPSPSRRLVGIHGLRSMSMVLLLIVSQYYRNNNTTVRVMSFPAPTQIPIIPRQQRDVLRTFTLVVRDDDRSSSPTPAAAAATCREMANLPEEIEREDEDEVEILFPTARRHYLFGGEKLVTIRTTSFGCSKHGHQIWPSSIALCLYFWSSRPRDDDCRNIIPQGKKRRVMELGAGCGLPSVFFRDVLGADAVMATDFWKLDDGGGGGGGSDGDLENNKGADDSSSSSSMLDDGSRLIPQKYHGRNLEYNVVGLLGSNNNKGSSGSLEGESSTATTASSVRWLDWHKPQSVHAAKKSFRPDLIVGCDLIYYPSDIQALWNTLRILMEPTTITTCRTTTTEEKEEGGTSNNNQPAKQSSPITVVLCSPLYPVVREALPDFQAFLEQQNGSYRVESKELILYQGRDNDDDTTAGEHFLLLSITKKEQQPC